MSDGQSTEYCQKLQSAYRRGTRNLLAYEVRQNQGWLLVIYTCGVGGPSDH